MLFLIHLEEGNLRIIRIKYSTAQKSNSKKVQNTLQIKLKKYLIAS